MANSTISTSNVVTKHLKKVNREYVRGGRFEKYIGKNENAVIQVKEDLKTVSIPLVAKLGGDGVTGSGTLAGNEEQLSNYAFTLTPTYHRQAVLVDNEEREKSEFDLVKEASPALTNWAKELKRDQIIQAMGAIEAGGTYANYGDASAANLDTWNTNNQDRILYGAAKSNLSAGDHTASLANVDTTNDKLDAPMITLMKRMAELADPLIRPIEVMDEEPFFVFFCGALGFRDLQDDSTIAQANREARPREVMNNPIFTGGDLFYDGVIIKKIADIDKFIDGGASVPTAFDGVWGANSNADSLATGGNSSSRVGVGFLCGAQAIGMGLGRMPKFTRRKEDDYEHQNGVGISLKHDIKKLFYNNKQHGMLTCFHSAAADS